MPSQTLGQRAAAILFSPETMNSVKVRGRKLSQEEVAQIIDGCASQKPDSGQSAAPTADFGNRKVIPPTPAQVTAYSTSIGYPMDGQKWCDVYEQKGWMVGKQRMKDWQAAVRNWKTNDYARGGIALTGAGKGTDQRDYSRL